MGCRGGHANGKAVRLRGVISGAWLSWCEGGRTGNSVHDRDGNDAKRQCMEGSKVEVGS